MHIVFKGSDFAEAHIVAAMLESMGIQTHVGGHHLQGALGEFGLINTIDVRVDQNNVEQAGAIVREYEGLKITSPHSPSPPSSNMMQSQDIIHTKNKHLYISLFLIAAILFSAVLIVKL